MSRIVTLLTDFGTEDPYAASMKGVIYGICPQAVIVDASHGISPQDVREASYFVAAAAPFYPEGSVHVIVVDPGVGTERLPLAASAGGRLFVCPDNGVLTLYLRRFPLTEARRIADPRCFLDEISATFHGRDIFAPTAARLACGMDLDAVGPPVSRIVSLELPEPQLDRSGAIHGRFIHRDHFGNLVSNIPRSLWQKDDASAEIQVAGHTINGIAPSYGSRKPGSLLAIWGSAGFLEVAVNRGSAAEKLAVGSDDGLVLFERRNETPQPDAKP